MRAEWAEKKQGSVMPSRDPAVRRHLHLCTVEKYSVCFGYAKLYTEAQHALI